MSAVQVRGQSFLLACTRRGKNEKEAEANGQLTMSLMMRTASPTDVAWNPIFAYPLTSSCTVIGRDA